MTAEPPAPLNALWVEGRLSWLERVCLASAVRFGHPVTLWTYFGVEGAPEGVAVADAREVMPEARMVKHRARDSWSLGSNLFRYALQRAGRGVWIDADLYFLKPLRIEGRRLVYGRQKPDLINGAVLYAAPDHPLLDGLDAWFAQEHIVPYWLPLKKRLRYQLRPWLGLKPLPLSEHRWGVAGPRAITHVARERGLFDEALPEDVFYPYGPKQAKLAFDPAADILALTTDRTVTAHLWNEEIRPLKASPPPAGSFLARVCAEQGIDPAAEVAAAR